MNVPRFIAFCGKLEYGRSGYIFAYISMTARARDFKFAETPVQRLQLAMVALTQNHFQRNMLGFLVEGHIYTCLYTFGITILTYSSNVFNRFFAQISIG